jgi:hypothetical protein
LEEKIRASTFSAVQAAKAVFSAPRDPPLRKQWEGAVVACRQVIQQIIFTFAKPNSKDMAANEISPPTLELQSKVVQSAETIQDEARRAELVAKIMQIFGEKLPSFQREWAAQPPNAQKETIRLITDEIRTQEMLITSHEDEDEDIQELKRIISLKSTHDFSQISKKLKVHHLL